MLTFLNRRNLGARSAALCLLALGATLFGAREARAQWTTSGTNTTTTNNVGIGIPTPSQIFHVHSIGTWAGTRVTTAATGTTINDGVHFGYDDAVGGYIWNREATPIVFSTSNAERARLDASGSFGIGTTTPGARLDVLGAVGAANTSAAAPTAFRVLGGKGGSGNWYGSGGGSGGQILFAGGEGGNPVAGSQSAVGGTGGPIILTGGDGGANTFGVGGGAGGNVVINGGLGVANSHGNVILANAQGFVGVGTTAPKHKLDVSGNMTIGSGYTSSNTVPVNGLVVEGGVGIGTSSPSAQYKLDVNGDIRISGNINAKYQDLAEWVPSVEKLAPATVVILDVARDNHVAASSSSYDTRVAGVISAQPGISLGEAGAGKVLVATTGRVKVRVDATQGPIKVGDLLVTSDRQGYAMKSEPVLFGKRQMHAPGTIIGKALESLAGGTGEILVLLSLQ